MAYATRNQEFLAGLQAALLAFHLDFQLPLQHHDKLVVVVAKVLPRAARRIRPFLATESTRKPLLLNLLDV